MKEPRLRTENRDQRLRDMKKRKEEVLDILEGQREHVADRERLAQSGRVRELLGGDPDEIGRIRNYQTGLDGLLNLCQRIQQAESPQEEIQRMQESLVQKDDEWVRDESGNDLRLVFFQVYFQIKQVKFESRGMYGATEDVLANLRSCRFNKEFLDEVVATLGSITGRLREYRESTEEDIKYSAESSDRFEETLARENEHVQKARARIERRVALTKKNILRLSDLIQQRESENQKDF